jgi:endonuclease YncB( thermonuclease family)
MVRAILALAILSCAVQAEAGQVSGQGRAIDSTIIEINNQRIMLFGIDSVVRKQVCTLDGKPWQCWSAAVQDLQSLLDEGPATCDVIGEPDIYGRLLARCTVNGKSLNEQLVSRGYALARRGDTTDYVTAEAAAKEKKVGLWQGQFAQPRSFRRASGVAVDRP